MTETQKKAKAKLDEEKRNKILTDLAVSLSRKDKREAREGAGITQAEMEDDHLALMIVLAKKKDKTLEWDALDEMGQRDLAIVVFGADLVPEELA